MDAVNFFILVADSPGASEGAVDGGSLNLTTVFIAIAGVLIIMMAWWRLRWKKAHEEWTQTGGSRSEERDATGAVRDSARHLLIEVEETSRAVNAQLGTKIKVLDELLRDADKKIARLEELTGKGTASGGAPASGIVRPAGQPSGPANGANADEQAVKDVLDPAQGDETMRMIYRRADAGEDAAAISKATGIPRGEVELILSLRSRRKTN